MRRSSSIFPTGSRRKRCTFFAFPWRWPDGEGCALRVVAVLDPKQIFRLETGR
jgi:hypothetical protein